MSRQNNGYILITTLLLLLVLTIVGLSAIGTSTVQNALSGNTRLRERNLTRAEAGADISADLIKYSLTTQNIIGYSPIVLDPNLPSELKSDFFDRDEADTGADADKGADVEFTVDTGTVSVDIDLMIIAHLPGDMGLTMNTGFENNGRDGIASYHRVNATGSGLVASEAEIGAIYRYVE